MRIYKSLIHTNYISEKELTMFTSVLKRIVIIGSVTIRSILGLAGLVIIALAIKNILKNR